MTAVTSKISNDNYDDVKIYRISPKQKDELEKQGYLFFKRWHQGISLNELSVNIGSAIDVEKMAPTYKITKIQRLFPREATEARANTYSSIFGSDAFPLHSDYAHWDTPPRYIILRCIKGSFSVNTHLFPMKNIYLETQKYINRAVVTPRRKNMAHRICAMPIAFSRDQVIGMRWDSVFLNPANFAASELKAAIDSLPLSRLDIVNLSDADDTLIIDNWRVLHGRSSVPSGAMDRCLERAFLSNLF